MTFKEKLKMEHPGCISPYHAGGCIGCPASFGYETPEESGCLRQTNDISDERCTACWNRTIPGTKKYFIYSQSTERVAAGDIIEVQISSRIVLSRKRVCSAEYPNLVLEDMLGDQTVRYTIHADRIEGITLLMRSTSTWSLVRDLVLGERKINIPSIKKVIFNDPATIVIWADGEKTVVKCQNGEPYDPEKGLAMAITKRALGNRGNYFDEIKKWTKEYKKPKKHIWAYKRDLVHCLHIFICGACGHTVTIPFSNAIICPPKECPRCSSRNDAP